MESEHMWGRIALGLALMLALLAGSVTAQDGDSTAPIIAQLGRGERDEYVIDGRAGEVVVVALTSAAFDPYLELLDADGNQVAFNDDFEGRNSQIEFTLPADGTYTVVARGYYSDAAGPYVLLLEGVSLAGSADTGEIELPVDPLPPTNAPIPTLNPTPPLFDPSPPLMLSQPGTLIPGDVMFANLPSGAADRWAFEGRSGATMLIALNSDDFDPYLELFDAAGAQLAVNDNTNGRNAQITATLPTDGKYSLVASSLVPDSGGLYILVMVDTGLNMGVVAAPPTPIVLATQIPPTPIVLATQIVPTAVLLVPTLTLPPATPTFPPPPPTLTPIPPPPTIPPPPPSSCQVFVDNEINTRGGPGTGFRERGELFDGDTTYAVGQMISPLGFLWYQLADGVWVRSDVVRTAGNCVNLRSQPVGGHAMVNTLDVNLLVRQNPSLNAGIVGSLPIRAIVDVLSGPVEADGLRWWQIRSPGGIVGWSPELFGGIVTLIPQVD
jgi:hypothetical protein